MGDQVYKTNWCGFTEKIFEDDSLIIIENWVIFSEEISRYINWLAFVHDQIYISGSCKKKIVFVIINCIDE